MILLMFCRKLTKNCDEVEFHCSLRGLLKSFDLHVAAMFLKHYYRVDACLLFLLCVCSVPVFLIFMVTLLSIRLVAFVRDGLI